MSNPLQQVRDYLADPDRWCKHAFALDVFDEALRT